MQARSFAAGRFQQQFQLASEQRRAFLKQLNWQPTVGKQGSRVKRQPHHPAVAGKHDAEIISLVANGEVEDV